MTNRRRSLPVEEDIVYEGEVITTHENTEVVERRGSEGNQELMMRKLEVANDFVQVGKQIVNVIAIREESKIKINEMDAEIRLLKQATEREIQILQESRKTVVSKGEVVANLLSLLTPILADDKLSAEDKQQSIDLFESVINQTVLEYEQS